MGISGVSSGLYGAAAGGGKADGLQQQLSQLKTQLEQWEKSDTDSEVKPQMIDILQKRIAQVQSKLEASQTKEAAPVAQPQSEPGKSVQHGTGNIIDISI